MARFRPARLVELAVCTAFYAGICWMLFNSASSRINNTAVAVGVKRQPNVVMITALHDKPCKYPNGDYLNLIR